MSDKNVKKRKKKREKQQPPTANRIIAQAMVEIQDFLREKNLEIKKAKEVQNKVLAKLIILETQECLNETLKIVLSK